jgi:hypothetical protein
VSAEPCAVHRGGKKAIASPEEGNVANRTRPTLEKRAKERARQEKRKLKEERRASAKAHRAQNPKSGGGEDPDIAGIVPGPQPSPWGEDEEDQV